MINQDEEIKKVLENHQESFEIPTSLENEIMEGISIVDAKKRASLNIKNILIFAAIAGLLVLFSLASQLYFPGSIWLIKAKLASAISLLIFALYQLAAWLPSFIDRFFAKAK